MSRTLTTQALVGGVIQLLLFPLVLFLAAGTLVWPAGWIFLILFYSFVVVTVRRLAKHHPGLLEERMSVFKPNSKRDTMFLLLCAVSLVWLIVMPLDAVRLHWSQVPLWLQVVGALTLIASFALMYPHLSGKRVCSTNRAHPEGAGTCGGVHRAIPVCASSDVHWLPAFLCRDAPLAGISVRARAFTGSHRSTRQTLSVGGAPVTEGIARL